MESNGDGIGDLAGITCRLDYLQWLEVDAIWLSPIFPSPMADFGYDIADYTHIDPLFGTLEDFDQLVAEAHRRQLKILLAYVPNHTSDQHPWFIWSTPGPGRVDLSLVGVCNPPRCALCSLPGSGQLRYPPGAGQDQHAMVGPKVLYM